MKKSKDIQHKVDELVAQEAAFIAGSSATQADQEPRTDPRQRRTTGGGKMPAEGFRRTSLDLPEELYRQLKVAAAEQGRTLQSLAADAFRAWLDQHRA